MSIRSLRPGLVAGCLLALAAFGTSAQDYPSRTISLVVPFPPGGSTDVQARLVAKGLQERLGQTVVVENKPGAAGSIGARYVAGAAADGYTLLFASTSSLVAEPTLNEKAGFDPVRDFEPVSIVTDLPWILVTGCKDDSPKTVAQLVQQAKAKPGALNYSTWGYGSAPNLLGEMFKLATQTHVTHIPYRGEAPAITGLIGGEVHMMFVTSVNMPHIQSKRICPLAVTGQERMSILPDVPTFTEAGIKNMDFKVWFGIVVPAKTPAAVIQRLQRETQAVTAAAEFTSTATKLGVTGVGSDAAFFTQRIRADQALITDLSKNARIRE